MRASLVPVRFPTFFSTAEISRALIVSLYWTDLTVKTEDHPNKYVRDEIAIATMKSLIIRGIKNLVTREAFS
jgi:hypothetical protein